MKLPVITVTGFLEAGKTTFLNRLLNSRPFLNDRLLLLQFEFGEEEFSCPRDNCDVLEFSKKDLEQRKTEIAGEIAAFLKTHEVDEIWVEWNGMAPLSELQALLSAGGLHKKCALEKVIYFSDAHTFELLLKNTGTAMTEQIADCDLVMIRNMTDASVKKRLVGLIRGLNPGVRVLQDTETKKAAKQIFRAKARPVNVLFLSLTWVVLLVLILRASSLPLPKLPISTAVNVFLGIMLQAVPFLLIGVLISSAIQILLPEGLIERRFPKKLAPGMLIAVLFGFFLPVCDCASVPIFRSLLKKGVPLPAAVTFLTATPVINPVVMLSTYYAFNGSLRVVSARILLGIVSALLIGTTFAVFKPKVQLLSPELDGMICACGCYDGAAASVGLKGKLELFLRHSQAEFFSVGKFLVLGASVSALLQAAGLRSFSVANGTGFALSLAVMMILAFLLSLCSSSDAVVARSLSSSFAPGSPMGFLVFGPMMDIKNIMMLSGGFSKKFLGLLLAVTFSACYLVVFLFARMLLGV